MYKVTLFKFKFTKKGQKDEAFKKTGKKCVAWSIVAVMAATVVPPGMLVKAAEPEDETGGESGTSV